MSAARAMVLDMDDGENAARLAGLLAMLALPMMRTLDGRYRRRRIEIEYRPGRWELIEGVEVKADQLTFWRGANGTTERLTVPASRCPHWRADKGESRHLVDDDDPRPRSER